MDIWGVFYFHYCRKAQNMYLCSYLIENIPRNGNLFPSYASFNFYKMVLNWFPQQLWYLHFYQQSIWILIFTYSGHTWFYQTCKDCVNQIGIYLFFKFHLFPWMLAKITSFICLLSTQVSVLWSTWSFHLPIFSDYFYVNWYNFHMYYAFWILY